MEIFEKVIDTVNFVISQSEFYKNMYGNNLNTIKEFKKLPYTDSNLLLKNKNDILTSDDQNCYIFTTGGSSGNTKTVYLNFSELHDNIKKHGESYKRAGIKKSDRVATFGLPGVLTSEFTVYLALEESGCFILPIGESGDYFKIYNMIQDYNINTLLLMPTDIVSFINFLKENNLPLIIPKIITGGEALQNSTKQFIIDNLSTKLFGATYQSMDFGTLGYQNETLESNQYIVGNQDLYLEIVNESNVSSEIGTGELVVTNCKRKLLPVIRYRTGDYVTLNFNRFGQQILTVHNRISNIPKIAGEKFESSIISKYLENNSLYTGRYQYNVDRINEKDTISLKIETINSFFDEQDEKKKILDFLYFEIPKLEKQIQNHMVNPIKIFLGLENELNFQVSNSTGKIINLQDERTKNENK